MIYQEKSSTHILLVEDNPLDVELLLDAFREAQIRSMVHVVRSGDEAMNYLFGRGEFKDRKLYPFPALVLLDLKLPGISGHDVLYRIKTTSQLKRLPVIILTSSQETFDLVRSYDNGANSYLVKPASANDFAKLVRQINQYWLTLNIGPPLFDSEDTKL